MLVSQFSPSEIKGKLVLKITNTCPKSTGIPSHDHLLTAYFGQQWPIYLLVFRWNKALWNLNTQFFTYLYCSRVNRNRAVLHHPFKHRPSFDSREGLFNHSKSFIYTHTNSIAQIRRQVRACKHAQKLELRNSGLYKHLEEFDRERDTGIPC
jgi:hypothetical protein